MVFSWLLPRGHAEENGGPTAATGGILHSEAGWPADFVLQKYTSSSQAHIYSQSCSQVDKIYKL